MVSMVFLWFLKNVDWIDKEDRNAWLAYFKDYLLAAHISDRYKETFIKRLSNGIV
jgi:hypothetical protein